MVYIEYVKYKKRTTCRKENPMDADVLMQLAEELLSVSRMLQSASSGQHFSVGICGLAGEAQIVVSENEAITQLGSAIEKALRVYQSNLENRIRAAVRNE
ncbi:MAG: hypothetical protein M0Q27_03400 [Candidatus Colwellbacteria bacterium]|nr:hypothetical protein [Candidatus Colwellbacteria bacterium]